MKYDFTTLPDRHGRDSIAVDGLGKGFAPDAPQPGFDAIPMWVADMNFVCLPTIQQAVIERVQHPAFGYFDPTPEYYGSIIRWQETRNDVTGLTAEAIGYENGVLGGVISALNCVCSRGDKVLVHSPTYIGFTRCLTNNGYDIVHSPLVQDENGIWRMDYADMEKHLAEEHIHAAILCSPHNPCGRVWERWELEKAMELYKKYNVYVVSDEIWSDIILSGHRHIPTQSISEDARMRTAALYAPSKTFKPRRPHRQLPHRLRPVVARPHRKRILPLPLQLHERPLDARSHRRLPPRGLCLGRRAVRDPDRQRGLRLRLYRPALQRRPCRKARGHLYALCGLHRLVRRPRQKHSGRGESLLGRRRSSAGRCDVPRPLPSAHQSGLAPRPH